MSPSVFSIMVPRAEHAVPVPARAAMELGESLAGMRVLCVDNDPDILAGMQALLQRWQVLVLTATTVDAALARVGMTDFRRRQIGELSGGQKKRVFLARAIAQEARVILLDEPFTGVDVKTEEAIIALLKAMREEGRVMLVSTHDLGSVPEYCDRVVMVKGTVLASGPTETTFTPENLRHAFGGVLRHFVLGGAALHDDADRRSVDVFTDDERPLVFYDHRARKKDE